jgi:hypothetical protein
MFLELYGFIGAHQEGAGKENGEHEYGSDLLKANHGLKPRVPRIMIVLIGRCGNILQVLELLAPGADHRW